MCDGTVIKTAARVNPTYFVMKGADIIDKFSYVDLNKNISSIHDIKNPIINKKQLFSCFFLFIILNQFNYFFMLFLPLPKGLLLAKSTSIGAATNIEE